MSIAVYKFKQNLLALSHSKDLEIAITEWREVFKQPRALIHGLCICQHKIKNIIYMYNIYTKHTISVGTACCKKFNLKINKLGNNILEEVIIEMIIKGEYKIINNILEYTKSIQLELIKYIRNKYVTNITNLEELKKLKNTIKDLIDTYDLQYLKDIYDEIKDKIIREERISFEEKEKHRIQNEEKEKELVALKEKERERIQNEEKEKVRIQNEEKKRIEFLEREKNERKEKERLQKLLCNCGITKENICICETPKYELVKLSKNMYCVTCNKWKCRCHV